MSLDRISKAIDRMDASAVTFPDLFANSDGLLQARDFEALLAEDQAARIEYAAALIERGWSVPYGLLHDVQQTDRPDGYEAG